MGAGRPAARRGRRRRARARRGRRAAGAAASSRAPTRAPSSASRRRATRPPQTLHQRFGDDAIYVVVREPVARVVLTEDLNTVLGLEGCLVRQRARRAHAGRRPAGPCGRLARRSRCASCSGRGRSSTPPSRRSPTASSALTRAPDSRDAARGQRGASALALARAATAPQQAGSFAQAGREVVEREVPDRAAEARASATGWASTRCRRGSTTRSSWRGSSSTRASPPARRRPASRRSSPGKNGALIQVRLRDGLSDAQRRAAIARHPRRGRDAAAGGSAQGNYGDHRRAGDRRRSSRARSRRAIVVLLLGRRRSSWR